MYYIEKSICDSETSDNNVHTIIYPSSSFDVFSWSPGHAIISVNYAVSSHILENRVMCTEVESCPEGSYKMFVLQNIPS